MSFGSWSTTEEVLAAFDDRLRRVRGASNGTRSNYARYVRALLERRFSGGEVKVSEFDARGVVEFINGMTRR